MSDLLTRVPWPWWALALTLAYVFIWLADRYDNGRLPRARASLDAGSAALDAIDPDAARDQREIEQDFSDEVEAWLRARSEFERWSQ